MEENGEGLFYLLYDGLGSVVAATNVNGQVVAQMAYDAFGKVFSQSGQAQDVRYGYTGRPMDKDIGLQYNRARHYDAGTGRWNRADEFRGGLMLPASLHRYVYAHQNPINASDPSGQIIWLALAAVVGLVVLAAAMQLYVNVVASGDMTEQAVQSEAINPEEANAYLHCVWNCTNIITIGHELNHVVTYLHEVEGWLAWIGKEIRERVGGSPNPESFEQQQMDTEADFFNNKMARGIFLKAFADKKVGCVDCSVLCRNYLNRFWFFG